jgi:hypothetical protein
MNPKHKRWPLLALLVIAVALPHFTRGTQTEFLI